MKFVKTIYNADCEKICIENVVGYLSTHFKKPSQYIEPYFFGDAWKKKTCLWLKGLPKLLPTKIVDAGEYQIAPSGRKYNIGAGSSACRDENGKIIAWNDPRTGKIRSKTYEGIAAAMSEQWGENPFIL